MRRNHTLAALLVAILPACGGGSCSTNVHHGTRDVDASVTPPGADAGTTTPGPMPAEGETCGNAVDDNGNGQVDEGCGCATVGDRQACWPGPVERRGRGSCRDGAQVCVANGEFNLWGECTGATLPASEVPGNGIDEDCDGSDPGGPGCAEFEDCGNGSDDDCDGLVDCNDGDCPPCGGCLTNEFGCGDGIDDDCDGLFDCADPECASYSGCSTPPPPPPGCTREFPFFVEAACGDGRDNDCDGHVDCDDSDCHHPGSCGCAPSEGVCTDGVDEDCDGATDCTDSDCSHCVPGSHRWCDDPMYCHWGRQDCDASGRWGTCTETTDRPPGCDGSSALYNTSCCVMAGECCQDYPSSFGSTGNCAGIETCS